MAPAHGGAITEADVAGDVLTPPKGRSMANRDSDIDEATSDVERQAGAEAEAELEAAALAAIQLQPRSRARSSTTARCSSRSP